MSVGSSSDVALLAQQPGAIAWMLAGLVAIKAAVNVALGPLFGLTRCRRARGRHSAADVWGLGPVDYLPEPGTQGACPV